MSEDKPQGINLECEEQALLARRARRPGDFEAHMQTVYDSDDERTKALKKALEKLPEDKL